MRRWDKLQGGQLHGGPKGHARLDRTIPLLLQGYAFLPGSRKRYGLEVFEGRFLARRVTVIAGRDAVRLLYDDSRLQRAGALPRAVRKTLIGEGGVQTLDDQAHRHRKAMFLSLLDAPSARALVDDVGRRWVAAANRWAGKHRVVLFDEAAGILSEAVCTWVGAPADEASSKQVADDLIALVEGFGNSGTRHLRARRARRRLEHWARELVRDVRSGRRPLPTHATLRIIAEHRELDGRPLEEKTAAVELLNVLRPTVAVAYYITFAALALHAFSDWRARIAEGDDDVLQAFAHEVRRYFPLAPAISARVRAPFTWRGHKFPGGRLVVLDVFGTDQDSASWIDPQYFDPRRFLGKEPDAYAMVPQGGGDAASGHRCPGERLTVELLKDATRFLATLDYKVPKQDLRVMLSRVPTRPRSGFVISRARTTNPVTA